MKRYDLEYSDGNGTSQAQEMVECFNGDWVDFDEAQEHFTKVALASIAREVCDRREAREWIAEVLWDPRANNDDIEKMLRKWCDA